MDCCSIRTLGQFPCLFVLGGLLFDKNLWPISLFVCLYAVRLDFLTNFLVVCSRWIAVRLELLANFLVLAAALFSVLSDTLTGAGIGLSLTYSLQVRFASYYSLCDVFSSQIRMFRAYGDVNISSVLLQNLVHWERGGGGGNKSIKKTKTFKNKN